MIEVLISDPNIGKPLQILNFSKYERYTNGYVKSPPVEFESLLKVYLLSLKMIPSSATNARSVFQVVWLFAGASRYLKSSSSPHADSRYTS